MIGLARSLVRAVVFAVLAVSSAVAGDVQIQKAAVGNSMGPGGQPQLDIYVSGTAVTESPSTLIGYFSDADSGAPLAASKGSSFSTTSGHLATSSSSFGGEGLKTFFQTKMSIPHFELRKEPLKKSRIELSLHMKGISSSSISSASMSSWTNLSTNRKRGRRRSRIFPPRSVRGFAIFFLIRRSSAPIVWAGGTFTRRITRIFRW